MKLVHIVSGLAVAISLAACADKSADIQTPAPNPNMSITANQSTIQQPNVSGTVWIRQKVALPPDAVLTVTLSDASLADTPSKVLSQKAVRTEGKQAPFSFVLPFNPSDIQPNARILLSAAITVDNKLVFITDSVKPVINNGGTKADLTLVPVQQTAVPIQASGGATTTVPSTSPTKSIRLLPFLRLLSINPAPTLSATERVNTPSDSVVNRFVRFPTPPRLPPVMPGVAVVDPAR
ncbi:lipoprotein [Salmonella enterica]|nr:lipoprotein [Salmonella enterica]